MAKSDRLVAEVLFPPVRAKVLEVLLSRPLRQRYVRELTGMTGFALHTVQDELRKLAAIGILKSWSNGYHRFYAADQNHPLFAHLSEIVRLSAKLPSTAHVALQRAIGRKRRRKRIRLQHLRIDRQPNWGLFKRPVKP